MKIKAMLIKVLGGVTNEYHLGEIENLKDACEGFYDKYCHLYGNNHSFGGNMNQSGLETHKGHNLVIVRSNQFLSNAIIGGELIVAPWVRNFIAINVKHNPENEKDES